MNGHHRRLMVDASITLRLKDFVVEVPEGAVERDGFLLALSNAVRDRTQNRLVILDIKGRRSCDEGMIDSYSAPVVHNWNEV